MLKEEKENDDGDTEGEWDARIRTLLSRAAAPLPHSAPPPPPSSSSPSSNPMFPPRQLHNKPAPAALCAEKALIVGVPPPCPANVSDESAEFASPVDVVDEDVPEMLVPHGGGFDFWREPDVAARRQEREEETATASRTFAEDIDEGTGKKTKEEDPLSEAETAERELLSGGTENDNQVRGSGDAVIEAALDALKPFTTSQLTPRERSYAGVVRLRDAHKELSLAIVGNVQGKPSSVAIGSGGGIAVGTTNGIIIVSRPQMTPGSSSAEHWDAESFGDDDVKEVKTKTTTIGISVPGATVSSLAFCANSRGVGFHPADSWLLAGHRDGSMVLWDVIRGTVVKEMRGAHQSPVIAVALVSPVMAAAAASAAFATFNAGSNANADGGVSNAGRLGNVGLSGIGPVEALSASLSGAVSRHTLTSIGPLVRAKVSCLGERTAVLQFQPLPPLCVLPGYRSRASDGIPPNVPCADVDASGVVALLTSVAIILMRLHPEAAVLAKLPRPSTSSSASLPCFAWAPRGIGKYGSAASRCTNVVVSWGRTVQLIELDLAAAMSVAPSEASKDRVSPRGGHAAVRIRQELNVEAPVIALAWLTSEIIVAVLTTNRLIAISSQTGELIEALHSREAPVHFVMEAGVGEGDQDHKSKACHAAVTAQGAVLTILSRSRQCPIRQVCVLGWRDRMAERRGMGDWGGAFTAALTASWERAPSLRRSLGAPPPSSVAAAAALDLLPQFIDSILRCPQPEASIACGDVDTSSTAEAARTRAIHVARAVIAVCLAADGLDRLYSSDVYDALISLPHTKAAFLELLVPHILADRLSSLPPEVMQSLVEHFVELGRPADIERCVLHMDVTSLDLNQCARLCKKHSLFSALAHIYNRALDDFIVPALALLNAAAADAAAEIAAFDARFTLTLTVETRDCREDRGYGIGAAEVSDDDSYKRGPARKLLLYLRESLRGQSFPPGRGTLPAERVPRVRAEIFGFLLAPMAVVEPSPFSGSLSSSTSTGGGCTPGLESKTFEFRRRWCDIGGAAGLAGVLWDAAYLHVLCDDASADLPFRHRLPQRLAFLLGVETSVTLDILSAALNGWDATESECFKAAGVVLDGPAGDASEDRMVSQVVVDCAIAAAEAFNRAASTNVESSVGNCEGCDAEGCGGEVVEAAAMACTRLLQFVAEIVGSGRATLTGLSRMQETLLLEVLALGPPFPSSTAERCKRESAMVAILARRIPMIQDTRRQDVNVNSDVASRSPDFALQLARRAGFHQAEALCHMLSGNHLDALRALAMDPVHVFGALRYADALLGTNFCEQHGVVALENPVDAAAHARLLKPDQAETFRASLLEAIPLLAVAAPDPTLHLAVTVFSSSQEAVLATLSNEPALQFRYLRGIFSCAAASVVDPAESNTPLCMSEVIAHSGIVITEAMTERYIHLLCLFEPRSVKAFLQKSPCGYHLRRCLTRCRYYNVSDAKAYLMERIGSADSLASPMNAHASHLQDAVRLFISGHHEDDVGAMEYVATFCFGVHSQSSHPSEAGLRDVVVAALGLCSRNSSKRAWRRGSDIRAGGAESETWVTFLDAVIQSLRRLRGGGECIPAFASVGYHRDGAASSSADTALSSASSNAVEPPSSSAAAAAAVSLRLNLEAMVCAVADAMTRFGVESPVTLSQLLADHKSDAFGDSRFAVMGLLVRFAKEVEVIDHARRCVTTDVRASVARKLLATNRGAAQKNIQIV